MDPKKILAPPSFSSAPDFQSKTNAPPSFSSAPDFSENVSKKQSRRETRSRSPTDKHRSKRSDRRDERSRTDDRSKRDKRRETSRDRRRRHSRERSSRKRSRSPDRKKYREEKRKHEKEPLHSGQLETGIMFVVDRYGDSDQLRYGIEASKIPEFHKVHRSSHYEKQKTLRDSSKTWELTDTKLKRLRIQPNTTTKDDPFASKVGFVKFADFEKKREEKETDYVSSGVDYRSVEGNKVKRVEEDADLVDDIEQEGESFQDYVRNRTIQFNRDLDKRPHDIQLWLQFIAFQDEAARGLDTGSTEKSKKGSISEVKLSIFEKAMDLNPDDEDLMLGYLSCGAETWETLTLLREWDRVIKRHPDSIRLWSEYINLRQTNFSSFTFTQCVQVFEDALNTLNRHIRLLQMRKTELNYEDRENVESLMVYMILRACLFMKQSGYHERAIALLQAVIEFNLFQPHLFSISLNKQDEKIASFAEFWDSEVARFGEEGALGWSEFYRAKHNGESPEDAILTNDKNDEEEEEEEYDEIKDWLHAEVDKEEKDRMPMRMIQADDDTMDEDPYRITLSDDIKPFLFDITTSGAKQSLVFSIFVFFGLPFTPPEVGTNTHFFTDTFTHNDMLLNQFWPKEDTPHSLVWYVAGVPMEPEHVADDTDIYHFPISYPVGVSELFATKDHHWFQCSSSSHVPNPVDQSFIRHAFEQLLAIDRQEYLCIYYLAFESGLGYKKGRQLAKKLLSQQKESLVLWNAYAQMEKSQGKIDDARKVYLTALSMYKSFSEINQAPAPLLYRMFAQLELDQNRPDEALKILVSMSDDKPFDKTVVPSSSPTVPVILRTREYFNQKKGQLSSLSESSIERQAAHDIIVCSALFEYLSCGIEEASRVYEYALTYLKERHADRSFTSETLWIEYARLHYHHAIKQTVSFGYQPYVVRNILVHALELFPNNSIFIALHAWNESRTKIYSRVKTFFDNSLKNEPNIILWLSAIYNELHRSKPYQVNQTRDFFERSIECTKTKCSILLWKLYIEFEIKQKNYSKAQSLFYRSLRECPWSKELYLIGIQKFQLSKKEINELISLVMEKEIRLRVALEDHLLD